MNHRSYWLALLVFCAAGLMPATAQAQWYGVNAARPAPLYPYELQPGQSYAVEVAPGAYVIHRPAASHNAPFVRCVNGCGIRKVAPRHAARLAPKPRRFDRPHKRNDPALIEEQRQREGKRIAVDTRKVARGEPAVILHRRGGKRTVVNTRKVMREAPVVIVHRRVVEKRVIHADAEITILGPDRMNIRLYRKRGHGGGGQVFNKK
jgi:hypothetical protein